MSRDGGMKNLNFPPVSVSGKEENIEDASQVEKLPEVVDLERRSAASSSAQIDN